MLIIFTGPPGAGKSTIGDKLAHTFPRSVNFSVDDIRGFVKGGYVEPWNDTDEEGQHVLATEITMDMIGRYLAKNFVVIIDDVFDDSGVEKYRARFDDVHAFLLLPDLETLKQRDLERPPHKQMKERAEELYNELHGREYQLLEVIDSSNQTPEETVQLIKNML